MRKLTIILACVAMAACGGTVQQKEQSNLQTTKEMDTEIIQLTAPQSSATLLTALKERKSVRAYADAGLTLDQLSGVLWAAAGQTRPDGKLTAPSAIALYPIRVYAVTEKGIYSYSSAEHKLTLVKAGDFRELAGLQDFVYTAPLNIMYIADLSVYEGRDISEDKVMTLCAMDAAGYCENANLWAAANGMGAVTRAGAKGAEFLATIDAPDTYRFILAQTVGIPE
jgi:nitroreductase